MLRTRLITALLLGPLILAIVFLGEPWLSLLIGVVAFLALVEVVALLDAAGYQPPQVLGIMAGIALAAAGLVSANEGERRRRRHRHCWPRSTRRASWRRPSSARDPPARGRGVHARRSGGRLPDLGDDDVRHRLHRPAAADDRARRASRPAGRVVDHPGRRVRHGLRGGLGADARPHRVGLRHRRLPGRIADRPTQAARAHQPGEDRRGACRRPRARRRSRPGIGAVLDRPGAVASAHHRTGGRHRRAGR